MLNELTFEDRISGCLLGGACGDALGAPVEFNSLHEIHQSYGPHGIRQFSEVYGRVGDITDDTQLTLFTAEGLAEAFEAQNPPDNKAILKSVHEALYRWRATQLNSTNVLEEFRDHPGLIQEPEMLGGTPRDLHAWTILRCAGLWGLWPSIIPRAMAGSCELPQ